MLCKYAAECLPIVSAALYFRTLRCNELPQGYPYWMPLVAPCIRFAMLTSSTHKKSSTMWQSPASFLNYTHIHTYNWERGQHRTLLPHHENTLRPPLPLHLLNISLSCVRTLHTRGCLQSPLAVPTSPRCRDQRIMRCNTFVCAPSWTTNTFNVRLRQQ